MEEAMILALYPFFAFCSEQGKREDKEQLSLFLPSFCCCRCRFAQWFSSRALLMAALVDCKQREREREQRAERRALHESVRREGGILN